MKNEKQNDFYIRIMIQYINQAMQILKANAMIVSQFAQIESIVTKVTPINFYVTISPFSHEVLIVLFVKLEFVPIFLV